MPKWVDQGENRVARILFGSLSPDSTLYLGLYTNTSEPSETATLSNINEPTGGGYSRQALYRGSWSISGSVATHPRRDFVCTATWGNVYGYFICEVENGTSGDLLCVEQFSDGPYYVTTDGAVKITSRITVS